MVTQDPFLFDGTIEENIKYGAPNATTEQIRAAGEIAMVTSFVETLPNGWNTQIGDAGKLLSGGQRQRISIARAIVGNPRILILDEATSQIDPKTEKMLQKRLKEYLRDRTVFIITHRNSTLELADRVITMDSGRVVLDLSAEEYLQRFDNSQKDGRSENQDHSRSEKAA